MNDTGIYATIIAFLYAAIRAGTPLLYGTLGEILTEKSGSLNLGVEGMMFMGAVAGFAFGYYMDSAILALLGAFLAGAFGALIYSFLTVTLKANQNVTGLTLTMFGTGFGNMFGDFIMRSTNSTAKLSANVMQIFNPVTIPGVTEDGIGKLILGHNWFVYCGIALALVMTWIFKRSRTGLNLRAVGESPATADAAGISVTRYKYLAACVGGGLCGIGGFYICLNAGGSWVYDLITGQGWIAVALVIFATWSPARALLGSFVFGGLSRLRLYLPINIPVAIYAMLPFIATIVVLIITSIRQSKEHSQPKSCGTNYFREER